MNEDFVCVCLLGLFDYLREWNYEDYVYTRFGHFITREPNTVDKDYYYDLYKSDASGLRLCCDGEQCKVLNKTDEYVELICVDNIDNEELEGLDTTFKLSIEEYNVAVYNKE